MLMEGKFTIKAPIQKLWDTLLDPETLLSCIPGAEKIERIDDLAEVLKDQVREVYTVGDCHKVGNAMTAIKSAYDEAIRI